MTPPWNPYPLLAVLGLLGVASGLVGGILTLKRKMFKLAMIGIALMIPEGIASPLAIFHFAGMIPALVWATAISIILLSLLSLIFIAMSRREFNS